MPESTELRYMVLPLTVRETAEGGVNFGLLFARKNKDRWVDVSGMTYELQTYDKGFTYIVLDDIVYMIHRDFLLKDEKVRLYIGKRFDHTTDVLHNGILSKDGEILHTWKNLVDLGKVTVVDDVITQFTDMNFPNSILSIPDSITGIDGSSQPFKNVNVGGIELSKGITKLEPQTFYMSTIENMVIPDTVTSIGASCFASSMLESIKLPSSLKSIEDAAFDSCIHLKSIDFENCEITEIPSSFLSGAELTILRLPDSVRTIKSEAFTSLKKIREIVIPGRVKEIGDNAFAECTEATIRIPDSVDVIGTGAFNNVRRIIYRGTAEGAPWGALSMN